MTKGTGVPIKVTGECIDQENILILQGMHLMTDSLGTRWFPVEQLTKASWTFVSSFKIQLLVEYEEKQDKPNNEQSTPTPKEYCFIIRWHKNK